MLLFWLPNVRINNSTIGRHLSQFRSYDPSTSKSLAVSYFRQITELEEKVRKKKNEKNRATKME